MINPHTQAWFASLYVVDDGLHESNAVVSLRGTPDQERVRLEEATRLVRGSYAPLLLVSVDRKSIYGHPTRALVEQYLRKSRFPVDRLRFCENSADSMAEEAQALRACLKNMGARQVIVVTSEYHTRRARLLFRKVFEGSGIDPLLHPVYNRDYWDPQWWSRRRWAETFFIETASLAWSGVERGVGAGHQVVAAFWKTTEDARATRAKRQPAPKPSAGGGLNPS